MKKMELLLKGLTCANCGAKIEDRVGKLKGVNESVLNFSLSKLIVTFNDDVKEEELYDGVKEIVEKLEPHVKVMYYKDAEGYRNINVCSSSTCSIEGNHEHHGHSHEHGHSNNKAHSHEHTHGDGSFNIDDNIPLIMGIALYVLALILGESNPITIILFIASYILVGGEIVKTAFMNILRGEIFDENFLMTIATLGAFIIGEHAEGVAVMIFYGIGEMFQGYAVDKSRKSISSLMNIKAEYAVKLQDGKEVKVKPEAVRVDDIIIIKPGERVALDGIIIEGEGSLDTSALTGESLPRDIKVGDEILAGAINLNSVIKVKVSKEYGQSTVARILELVENASNKKGKTEKFITKFARYYTPIVVFIAIALAVVPPLVLEGHTFSEWIYRALIFLVVSCPCALVVSVPLGLFAGIGGASKKGVLIKGGNYIEILKNVDTVVFDKTGTLTKGEFGVSQINEIDMSKEDLLKYAAHGESFSNHPIAQSVVKAYSGKINKNDVKDYKEISGHGISATILGKKVLLGNDKLMKKEQIGYQTSSTVGTIIHIAINGVYEGNIVIGDKIKETSKEAISKLKEIGIKKTVMLTGDNKLVADAVGKELGLDEVYGELLPGDKVTKVEEILENAQGKVIFVGDGINDAPVLARADIGIAMGGIGSDAAIEAADVVLMKDDPKSISDAIKIGRKTTSILWQNIIFALGVKVLVMILSAFGVANMWIAVFADVGVTLIAVINSMRALK
ncbi:MAG: heavy metal translocating P-type ATPase [Clostridium sp.]